MLSPGLAAEEEPRYNLPMTRIETPDAECLVFTFKDGLLSSVGHDLQLRVGRFWIEVEPSRVRAEFDSRSLEVVGAMEAGRLAPEALTEENKKQIAATARNEVLHANLHPTATFESKRVTRSDERHAQVVGTLCLCGAKRTLTCNASATNGQWLVEVELLQSDYGIRPYRALMGALKVQDRVRILLRAHGATN